MRIYNAKVGTVPMLIQLRYRYALVELDRVLYRPVTSDGKGGWRPMTGWEPGLVDETYPYPHNPSNLLRLSKF